MQASVWQRTRLHDYYTHSAALHPQRPAVIVGERTISYAELEALSDSIAARLQKQGVLRGDRVGMWLPRSLEAYAALLGILKAGAAYVPMDAAYPPERVQFISTDAEVRLLITLPELAATLDEGSHSLMVLDAGWETLSTEPFTPADVSTDDLAYIIYTSGSTGKPKGVPIPHACACHFVNAEAQVLPVTAEDRVFQGFSLAFDASVEELWLAWGNGAALVCGSADLMRDTTALAGRLSQLGITVLSCVPTLLAMLEHDMPCLRLLIVGGEACPQDLVRRWTRGGRRMVNTYGPTEATVVATWHDLHADEPVKIGKPLPGYHTCVVDDQIQRLPSGKPGELLIGGPCLTPGYLNRPELNQEKFISPPWAEGARWYRTGDLVRLDAHDALEFLGRIDDQVKLRGFRIELGEIESVIMSCTGVAAAAVAVKQDAGGTEFLAAYVTLKHSAVWDEKAARHIIGERLPPYMMPAVFTVLEQLPTLPSGKINRKALPDISLPLRTASSAPPAEFTPAQQTVYLQWQACFPGTTPRLTDDFFDLGGHSLLATRIVSELRTQSRWANVSVMDVYRQRTLAAFAQKLDELEAAWRATHPAATAEHSDEAAHVPAAPGTPPGPALLVRHFCCGMLQFLALYPLFALASPVWLASFFVWDEMVAQDMQYQLFVAIIVAVSLLFNLQVVQAVICIAAKWLIIGRIRPGRYPLWGWYYFRFWLVQRVHSIFSLGHFKSTPMINLYFRLMGAKIGRQVHLGTASLAAFDVVSIGDRTSIGHDAVLNGYTLEKGWLIIGPITIGADCFIGSKALVNRDARMEPDSSLDHGSMLPPGGVIPAGEYWHGAPARASSRPERWHPKQAERRNSLGIMTLAYMAGLMFISVIPTVALLPGAFFIGWIEEGVNLHGDSLQHIFSYESGFWKIVMAAPFAGASYVVVLCLIIALAKKILLGRVQPGIYPLHSLWYVRQWFIGCLLNMSLELLFPLYASIYLPPWLRMLGAKLGKNVEVSTAENFNPDLLDLSEGVFVADAVCLGASEIREGWVRLQMVTVGKNSFLGNSAVVPGGTTLASDSLVGVLSMPPQNPADALQQDSSWLGIPSFALPHREKNTSFGQERTYKPTMKLRLLRATIELIRVVLPTSVSIIGAFIMFLLLSDQLYYHHLEFWGTILLFPVFLFMFGLFCMGCTIVLKWLVIGRYRPAEHPLWSHFVWRTELMAAVHEHLAMPALGGLLIGTPFLPWYFRLLGARIGRRCCLETPYLTEFDLVHLGDDVCLGHQADPQTHLFEDRVMKMSTVTIGDNCSVGPLAVVLYDAEMKPGSRLDGHSLLMKGETLPPYTRWHGSPAQRIDAAI
ncbi:Pls/PosA family non-ribosomal peptide synthetase [Prosthecobacter vanneervenii]|uniref:Non-ribosomal peptide synthetase-like protein n=1 Tax=Prosthecobacter vanneervenii TaxID=48466 RepID=A0A7W7YCE2_9BACT|nr:Pls/PosA family non-ribosomal peptide synthetase [Prosthecobacter vanneervenii]MBB5033584.1 non-ribosomal peptide synthetase-like protein [Prosthecobacter vanneervenii]